MRTATTSVYTFDELSAAAKEKAIKNHCFDAVNDDSWYKEDYPAHEELRKMGLGVEVGGMYFDLDRQDYLYFDWHPFYRDGVKTSEHAGLWVEYPDRFAEYMAKNSTAPKAIINGIKNNDLSPEIKVQHYSLGAGKNYVALNCMTDSGYMLNEEYPTAEDAMTAALNSALDDLRREIRDDYTERTSNEYIAGMLSSSDYYEFRANGSDWL